jgi:hypothetical protein
MFHVKHASVQQEPDKAESAVGKKQLHSLLWHEYVGKCHCFAAPCFT